MAYSYDFKDNVVYGADDINAIRASILTKGVIEESQSSCMVTVADGVFKICKGQAVFKDGCRIEVDDEGTTVDVTSGTKNYIYFYNNTLAGVCEVKADTLFPTGDYVLLAEIDENGDVSDKREFAQLKTADTERYAASFSGTLLMRDNLPAGEIIGEIELPKSNCSYIEFDYTFATETFIKVRLFPREDGHISWCFANGVFYSGKTLTVPAFGKTRETQFEVSGNKLILRHMSISGSVSTNTYSITIDGVCMR